MERTLSQLRLYPDLSTVTIDNFLARGKINTRAYVFLARVQALENHKNSFRKLGIDADAVDGLSHTENTVGAKIMPSAWSENS